MIELWFDFASPYSYPAVMRIETLAAERGVPVTWRPMMLGPVFRSLGWTTSPFIEQRYKLPYMWLDLARVCRRHNLPWRQPTVFPRGTVLPLRVVKVGAEQPWIGAFCRAVMTRHFADDQDIDRAEDLIPLLDRVGANGEAVIAAALQDDNKQALRDQVEQAIRRGIFGAPTFFVGDDMYWGHDRMETALDEAAARRLA